MFTMPFICILLLPGTSRIKTNPARREMHLGILRCFRVAINYGVLLFAFAIEKYKPRCHWPSSVNVVEMQRGGQI